MNVCKEKPKKLPELIRIFVNGGEVLAKYLFNGIGGDLKHPVGKR